MVRVLEKVERRLGERLLLKGDRCSSPKCAHARRGYPPGMHGKKRSRNASEYGQLMREKQKVRFVYNLDDKDIKRYIMKAAEKPGLFNVNFIRLVEMRLDNGVYRFGFALSRRSARHAVKYGHISVNGRRVDIPSYQLKKGDVVSVRELSSSSVMFSHIDAKMKKYTPPQWLEVDMNKKQGTVVRLPEVENAGISSDFIKIKEFYSR